MSLRIMRSNDPEVPGLLSRAFANLQETEQRVNGVVQAVRERGDAALAEFTARFDGVEVPPGGWRVTRDEIDQAYSQVDAGLLASLRAALVRIRDFHARQLVNSWMQPDSQGNMVGQLVRPLRRVGVYVPGGSAAYPSSVLMNAVPAVVAGVREMVMVTPPRPDGSVNPLCLVAAAEAGITEIYRVGGAQAIAALAYGTESIQRVDKITGPGNIYVTLAKKAVYGQVDIDMLAGPSEVLVVADETARPDWVAADLLSQAEHDAMASAVLITPVAELARAVAAEVERQLAELPRCEIAGRSIKDNGAAVITVDLAEAVRLANRFAPEHLELAVAEPFRWLGLVENAGAVFLGHHAPEPVGDYYAGPNHVLPTGGTARFYSPLGVETFLKKTSVIYYTLEGLATAAPDITRLATAEGLSAHARAVEQRMDAKPGRPAGGGRA